MPYWSNHSMRRSACDAASRFTIWSHVIGLLALTFVCLRVSGAEDKTTAQFRKDIQPILREYCYDCHGDGESKGKVAFDELKSDDALLNHDLWLKVMKNVRAGLMPPQKKTRLTPEAQTHLESWIKYAAFAIDPKNPDPGRVTVRRLNRVEYRNTIRDLMGVEFNTDVEFPPDDTGYGFDNIGDVLTVSPMLLEKYMAAATAIVADGVPTVSKVIAERTVAGNRFRREGTNSAGGGRGGGNRGSNQRETMLSLSHYEPATVFNSFKAEQPGTYQLTLRLAVKGEFDFDPGKCRVIFKVDDRELLQKEFGWYDNKTFNFDFEEKWQPGEHRMTFEVQPLTLVEQKINSLEMRIVSVTVRGPMEEQYWTLPKNYERFFTKGAPKVPADRRQFAHEILGSFATKAFRRPVDDQTVDRLVTLAESVYTQPGKTFETGVAHAMVAVLSSTRFLFRVEEGEPASARASYSLVDEYSLASRLSYFLWSSMPDDELFRLAAHGELRKNLPAQVKRMIEDSRSEALVKNFTGQWLQTRDVEGISIDARTVLARDKGQEKELKRQQEEFRARIAQRAAQATQTNSPTGTNQLAQQQRPFNRQRQKPSVELNAELRQAMERETEMFFSSILHEDRSVTELIDSDYTFLNQKLATVYGLTNLDVTGTEMRRVTLPPGSARGGVLTHGSVLVITSNPDRTSPVKRGLFVLDNVLGVPPAPPPPNIPALEVAEKDVTDHEPLLRESLELHRNTPLCASCHMRMDPIGLAFENFNALGMWREQERNQPIETGGKLVTGETFNTVGQLKHILVTEHRQDFYRCLTGKMLTYALGRGPEYYDVETVDQIVQRLNQENGRFSALLMGIIESAPFQKQRNQATATAGIEAPAQKQIAKNKTTP